MRRFLFFILLLSPLAAMPQIFATSKEQAETSLQIKKFNQFYGYLNNLYIDTVNNERLIENAIINMLAELDPHSIYTSKKDMVEVRESFDGKFSGIGVQISVLFDSLHVVNVISGGPSEKVGVMPNDRIVTVDGISIVGMKQADAVKLLRGPKGSFVMIDVVRPGLPEQISFRIKRDNISIESVDAAYMIVPKTGYIKVNRFAHTTMDEVTEALKKLGNIDGLILDLRGNSGGLLNQAVDMANLFLPQGAVIVSTQGRLVPSEVFTARRKPGFQKGKVVVLIDEMSASASEIVAGALQDWDRAVIVGRRSFGKGLVQRQLPLVDGAAVNITIARYLTPTGRAIQRPYKKGDKEGYYEDFAHRLSSDYIDSLAADGAERYETLTLGKMVYGGGGIYPDYYIPHDTTWYSEYFSKLVRKGITYEYQNIYLDNHRQSIVDEYPDFEAFKSRFEVTDRMLSGLAEFGATRDVPVDEEGLKRSANILKIRFKAGIAQAVWGMTEAVRIYNDDDDTVKKARDIIANWSTEAKGIAITNIK